MWRVPPDHDYVPPALSAHRRPAAPPPIAEDRRLVVSSGEAANMLGISEKHLYMMSREGEIPRVTIGGRVCYRVESLRAWLAANEK